MLVITGIFEDGRFIPDKPVKIPEKRKVVVTIEEQCDSLVEPVNHTAFGRLQEYSNPSLIPEEKGAWETAVAEKYVLR